MIKYNLFIDDERDPVNTTDVIARSSKEAIAAVEKLGWPEHISFDHDLGGDDTAMVFVRWVIERCIDEVSNIPFSWSVHSQNPIGAENIDRLLESYCRTCLK